MERFFTKNYRQHYRHSFALAPEFSNIVRRFREEAVETEAGSQRLMKENFPEDKYVNVKGLCKAATLAEIEAQGWSLNPGRYVGVAERAAENFEFRERLEELNEALEVMNAEARGLEEIIALNVTEILD
jgi:type I restriction enzyme M protein